MATAGLRNPKLVFKIEYKKLKGGLKYENVRTDNGIFRLHYKLTVWLVVLYSFILTLYVYIGGLRSFSCSFSRKNAIGKPENMNLYCWIHGVYLANASSRLAGKINPGIAGLQNHGDGSEVKYILYYKWMPVVVIISISLLYVPRQLWLLVEKGRMKMTAGNLSDCGLGITEPEEILKHKRTFVKYLHALLGYNTFYSLWFIICEFLNVIVSLILIILVDVISEKQFSEHGIATWRFMLSNPSERTDPLAKAFPTVGICKFNKYGPGGGIVPYEGICVMTLNRINEFSMVFFWYYLMILFTLGVAGFMHRLMCLASKTVRRFTFGGIFPIFTSEETSLLVEKVSYSDWFFLNQLSSIIDPIIFREGIQTFLLNWKDSAGTRAI